MFSTSAEQLERTRLIGGFNSDVVAGSEDLQNHLAATGSAVSLIGWLSRFESETSARSGIERRILRRNFLCFGLLVILGIAARLFSGLYLPLLAPLLVIFVLYFRITSAVSRRIDIFERDYPTLLISLASAVRTGLDPVVALSQSDLLFNPQSEVSRAIVKYRHALESGFSEEKAIAAFASDIQHPDLQLFRSAFVLARKHGSSIGECLHRLTKVTRQRQSFRRKVRAAVAMQKLSAIGIFGCAITIGIIQYLSNPKALVAAMQHPVGMKLLMLGAGLIAAGLVWMLIMVRRRF